MAGDFFDSNNYLFGFQIHHIFPSELYNNPTIAGFLAQIGIPLESQANKIALPTSALVTSFFQSNPGLENVLAQAGTGISRIMPPTQTFWPRRWSISLAIQRSVQIKKTLQAFQLLQFANDVSTGRFPGGGISGSAATSAADPMNLWNSNAGGATLPPDDQAAQLVDAIKQGLGSKLTTLTDATTSNNYDERYARAIALADQLKGPVPQAALDMFYKAIANAGTASGSSINQGNAITAAPIGLLSDVKNELGISLTLPELEESTAGKVFNEFWSDTRGSGPPIDMDTLISTFKTIIDYAEAAEAKFFEVAAQFETTMEEIMVRSLTDMLKVSKAAIAAIAAIAVTFVEQAYDSIKTGLTTGDGSNFINVANTFGWDAIWGMGEMLAAAAVAAAVAFPFGGPPASAVAAEFVLAGFGALGIVGAAYSAGDLVKKIGSDLAAVIPKIGDAIEQYAANFAAAVNLIFADASKFTPPAFQEQGRLVTYYVADGVDPSLPFSFQGGATNDRFYERNNAYIDAGPGNDEIYFTGNGTGLGGDGNDIVAGINTRVVHAGDPIDPAHPDWGLATTELHLVLDGGPGNDWVLEKGGVVAVTAGGLGRDWLFNTSVGGVIWGDVQNSLLDTSTDQRYYVTTTTDANGNTTTTQNWISDDSSNAENFFWSPNTTI
jgi:hypothetical protein